ncbi:amino acid ABC transporter ATP-binding protein [Sporosarcina psychrophila]|uniref:Polar amino acid transport system ATP-binding protein n=1 Tax=Sporosarcina psychrophila TaxID=1476 RepID=A0ABV2K378_SPOPS
MSGTSILSVSDLEKSYGDIHVLKGVSLDVKKGEVISIIGPSGTGKSTLLRCLNFLEEPSGGTIDFDGEKYCTLESHSRKRMYDKKLIKLRSKIGMVFQQFNLWPHMTVLQNVIEGPMKIKGMSKEQATKIAKDMLDLVKMGEKANQYPNKLSGGQQQRVAIARALAMEPEIMLFDEVTSALDPQLVGEVLDVMTSLAKQGMTMLAVTHEMRFAEKVGTRVIFMDKGKILSEGSPDEFFHNNKNDRVQEFLSSVRNT